MQRQIFVSCPRYSPSQQPLSENTPGFVKETINNFQTYISDATGFFLYRSVPQLEHVAPRAIGQ